MPKCCVSLHQEETTLIHSALQASKLVSGLSCHPMRAHPLWVMNGEHPKTWNQEPTPLVRYVGHFQLQ